MAADGIYIVEDTQLSFRAEFGGDNAASRTIFALADQIALSMHTWEGHYAPDRRMDILGDITRSIMTLRNAIVVRQGANSYPFNLAMSMAVPAVREVSDLIEREADANSAPRAALSRIDMLIRSRRHDEAETLAFASARANPHDREVLTEFERMMPWAQRPEDAAPIRAMRERSDQWVSVAAFVPNPDLQAARNARYSRRTISISSSTDVERAWFS